MAIQIGGNNVVDNNRKGIFQSANLGSYTPANRPGSASVGDTIYNSTEQRLQVWNGSAWVDACKGPGSEITATGGTITTVGKRKIHRFTSPGTFSVTSAPPSSVFDYVIVAGGGGSGGTNGGTRGGSGGGGGGGCLIGSFSGNIVGNFTVTIGSGGGGGTGGPPTRSVGSNGNPSSISGPLGTATAIGGGGGGVGGSPAPVPLASGLPGGSGGGAGSAPFGGVAGAGTPGQGTSGGSQLGGTNFSSSGAGGSALSSPVTHLLAPSIGATPTNSILGIGKILDSALYGPFSLFSVGGLGAADAPGGDYSYLGEGFSPSVYAANTGSGGSSPIRGAAGNGIAGNSGIVIIAYSIYQ